MHSPSPSCNYSHTSAITPQIALPCVLLYILIIVNIIVIIIIIIIIIIT